LIRWAFLLLLARLSFSWHTYTTWM